MPNGYPKRLACDSFIHSGGNQRKLAISAALLGLPPIVFLDEPYAGVDVVSRTKIFHAIGLVKQRTRTAFLLSSHNLDECEISCDRLTILVQGQMICLGTVQHLREKFGKGYRLHVMLKHGAASDAAEEAKRFLEAVPSHFPGITLADQHENVFSYYLVERIKWSELFRKVQDLEKDFSLEYAIVGDNTLEQIFIAFAKPEQPSGIFVGHSGPLPKLLFILACHLVMLCYVFLASCSPDLLHTCIVFGLSTVT
ncbi:hypothetical protein HPB48_000818 [Haemaphysalis longicornis]|uniref:ABCA1-4-like C-terminal R2 regulatory domain-containing protein n=1 Tax=Haemaphysalis longicornis TaxID=44386 RepID=A0A9J6FAH8_HAELO|nr:hypothetical protein HPB48_000818 [Haemaphysalis longicornis]